MLAADIAYLGLGMLISTSPSLQHHGRSGGYSRPLSLIEEAQVSQQQRFVFLGSVIGHYNPQ